MASDFGRSAGPAASSGETTLIFLELPPPNVIHIAIEDRQKESQQFSEIRGAVQALFGTLGCAFEGHCRQRRL